jgi:hypothetical protein
MTVFDAWLSRKLTRGIGTLREARTAEAKFIKVYGPRSDFAVLELTGEPYPEFEFRSKVEWPEEAEGYNTVVLDGILDELLAANLGPSVIRARFTLETIEWHAVDSSQRAFYFAARDGVRQILALHEWPTNVVCD